MDPFHERLARIAFANDSDLGLILAGGYAISAHNLTTRPSKDLDFASLSRLALPEVAGRLAEVYRLAGFRVDLIEADPTMSRLVVCGDDQECEVDLLRLGIAPPVLLDIGPVLTRDDAVGLKVGALHDRSQHRDFIDVHAAHTLGGYDLHELERLGASHTRGFNLSDLLFRLDSLELLDDETFAGYGLTEADVTALHRWARTWADDIRRRLAVEDLNPRAPSDERDWDTYLDG